jgi:hypothetical protein
MSPTDPSHQRPRTAKQPASCRTWLALPWRAAPAEPVAVEGHYARAARLAARARCVALPVVGLVGGGGGGDRAPGGAAPVPARRREVVTAVQLRRRLDAFPFDEWSPAAEAAAHTLQRGGHPTSSVQGCGAGAGAAGSGAGNPVTGGVKSGGGDGGAGTPEARAAAALHIQHAVQRWRRARQQRQRQRLTRRRVKVGFVVAPLRQQPRATIGAHIAGNRRSSACAEVPATGGAEDIWSRWASGASPSGITRGDARTGGATSLLP